MKTLRLKTYTILLMVLMSVIAGCSTTNNSESTYVNGWYITKLPYNIDQIYNSTLNAIESGITYADDDSNYDLRVNNKTSDKAIIEAVSNSQRGDTLVIELVKLSDNLTKVGIKYGKHGNSMRSSAVIVIITRDIN